MKLTFSAYVYEFDKASYFTELQAVIKAVFYKAGQRFLLAAIPRIPIFTGFARSAFKNLEDVVGQVGQEGSGYRIRGTRKGGTQITGSYPRGYYYRGIERNPQSGRQFATAPSKIFNFTGATLATGRTAFYFRFEVDITYFDYLDKARWGAFKAGSEALQAYIQDNLEKNLPDPVKFITQKRITS